MEWLFLPKTRKYKGVGYRIPLNRLRRRKKRHQSTSYLYKHVLGIFLIIFALQVGESTAFTLYNPLGFWTTVYSDGIHVPKIESGTKPHGSRLYFIATITADGQVKFDGIPVAVTDYATILQDLKMSQPKTKCLLVADRDTPMHHVQQILGALREQGLYEVYFVASHDENKFY